VPAPEEYICALFKIVCTTANGPPASPFSGLMRGAFVVVEDGIIVVVVVLGDFVELDIT
jgi:hypothetical protein